METEVLLKIKKTLESKKSTRDMLIGKKNTLIDRIKELGFSSVQEAEKALTDMDKELEVMENNHKNNVYEFKTKYKGLLSEVN